MSGNQLAVIYIGKAGDQPERSFVTYIDATPEEVDALNKQIEEGGVWVEGYPHDSDDYQLYHELLDMSGCCSNVKA